MEPSRNQKMEYVFVRKLPVLVLAGVAAAAVAGSAIAATAKTHVMNVALPDGSVAHVQYVGDVAPKVTIEPGRLAGPEAAWAPMGLPSFAGFDRMMADMQRQSAELIRRAQEMAKQPVTAAGAAPYIAAYGNLPAGETSTTVVSVSNGGATCTRTTEVVSQGAGKPPKVTSNVSGECGSSAAPSKGPVNPT